MTDPGVIILYNKPHAERGADAPRDSESDAGILDEVAAVSDALAQLNVPHRTIAACTLGDVGTALAACPESLVINIVESLHTSTEDAFLVPAVCTALGKAWTGNGTPCQLLALDKWLSKCALDAAGVPVPAGVVVPPNAAYHGLPDSPGSVIVKPLRADASEGIDSGSVIDESDPATLHTRVARIHRSFGQPAVVERYVNGRELNVSLLERDGEVTVLPIAEIDFSAFPENLPRIVDYRAKWIEDSFEFTHTPRRIPADLDEPAAQRIRSTALAAWRCLGCRDYARVDIRLDATGIPYVIEVNPNPDISPDAGFAAALGAGGLAFRDFVQILLSNAGRNTAPAADADRAAAQAGNPIVRWSQRDDRPSIIRLIEAAGIFRPCEVEVAREVLDEALAAGEAGHYQSYTAVVDDTVAGWACFGPVPCTSDTYDLYWLAVSPAFTRRGTGSALLARVEAAARARAARQIVAETSSRRDYAPAHRFYEHHGFRQTAVVPDFYAPADHKVIYVKAQDL